ncbi:leucine zipper protein 2 isoform X4 [Hyperolius riggenbachi]|uniref:leucine zipper protein 2 isoform X4 n=1 Tax=Hyperolius riggenbachi TaxID=752182 RepID=UPI0035A36DB3
MPCLSLPSSTFWSAPKAGALPALPKKQPCLCAKCRLSTIFFWVGERLPTCTEVGTFKRKDMPSFRSIKPSLPNLQPGFNKSLKNKLLSGNKLCGLRAEESKRIQAQLKELRYGKKDLVSKAQQLTDLEQKLTVAKREMEIASLDNESQLKALKETVQLCLTSVLHNQPPAVGIITSKPTERPTSSREALQTASTESQKIATSNTTSSPQELTTSEFQQDKICDSHNVSICHITTSPDP